MDYPGRSIKAGESDPAIVRALRTRLRALGFEVGRLGRTYDAPMVRAVKLFQARHVDHRGAPLEIDGIVGAFTWHALFGIAPPVAEAPASSLSARALVIARGQLGVREVPPDSNRGPAVEAYLASVGLGPGHAWCAAFVHWCLAGAARELGVANPCARSGSVLAQWRHAGERRLPRVLAAAARNDPTLIRPGMVFTMDYGGGLGHTGFITRVEGGQLETLEGNTDASLSREGGGVYAHTRKVGDINKGYVLYG